MKQRSKKTRKAAKSGKRRAPDEVFSRGPMNAARFGNVTLMKSAWDREESLRFRAQLPELRAEREAVLKQRIQEVVALVRKFDPLELLATLFTQNSVHDPTEYAESASSAHEYLAEYVLSLFTATPAPDLAFEQPTESTGAEVVAAVEAVYEEARNLILFEPESQANEGLEEFRVQMLLRHLAMRGDSYPEHHVDLFRRLGAPHDPQLRSTCGFSSAELISTFLAIEKQIQKRLDLFLDWMSEVRDLQTETFARLNSEGAPLDYAASEEEVQRRIQAAVPEEGRRRVEEKHAGLHKTGRELLTIDITDPEITRAVLDACSCGPGDNAAFLTDPVAGYPTKESIVWTKPIVRIGDAYYCPSPPVLFRSCIGVLESLLNRGAYAETYQHGRGETLEQMAVEYLRRLLPGAAVGTTLYYPTDDGGRAETDAVFLLDRHVFVVEAKAGALTLPARRGAPGRLKRDFGKIIEDAFVQGTRVRNYILGGDEARFEDEAGNVVLTLRKSEIDTIHVINPTLASMNPLGVQLGLAREKGLLSEDTHWPWCIFINDLRIISELIESPSEFVLFLQRRFATNATPYSAHDELDLLCKFLADGLYHEPAELKGISRLSLHGYTDVLDRWYVGRPHGLQVQKPARALPSEVRALARALEAMDKPYRTEATLRLVELNQDGLDKIHSSLVMLRARCVDDGKEHDATLQFRNPVRGISIYVSRDGLLSNSALRHAVMRKHLSGGADWLAISVAAVGATVDFAFLRSAHVEADTALQLERIRRDALAAFVAEHGRRPERNDPCPCTSGRKFKKCCHLLPGA